jgi:hypothetical protein
MMQNSSKSAHPIENKGNWKMEKGKRELGGGCEPFAAQGKPDGRGFETGWRLGNTGEYNMKVEGTEGCRGGSGKQGVGAGSGLECLRNGTRARFSGWRDSRGGRMRRLRLIFGGAVLLFAIGATAQQGQISDAKYISEAVSAAPAAVAKGAAVVRVEKDGSMRTIRAGSNGFTCMIMGTDKMCNDANSMEFIHAMMKMAPPPDKVGISYMLAGDEGASNTDPAATGKTADNHWIVTGPHIMVFGPASKTLGYTEAKDPDPKQPYMMWAGTPYEHAMIPVAAK